MGQNIVIYDFTQWSKALMRHYSTSVYLSKATAERRRAFDIVANLTLKAGNNNRHGKYLHAISKPLRIRLCFCLRSADRLYSDTGRDLNKKYTCQFAG